MYFKLVETKNGESYDGILNGIDTYMNIRLKDVIVTAASGTSFSKHPEAFIRGNNVKSMQLPEDIIERHIEDIKRKCKLLPLLTLVYEHLLICIDNFI